MTASDVPAAAAIIPARSGSRRIPDKNIRLFCGKPMIQYAIEAARESGLFSTILVSTDSPRIAEMARAAGAQAPFLRPAELSHDHASSDAVILHALQFLRNCGPLPEFGCCLYPSVPFLLPADLREAMNLVCEQPEAIAFPVAVFPAPIERGFRVTPDGRLEMLHPEHETTRTQDLEEAYYDAGQFYVFHIPRFLERPRTFGECMRGIVLPSYRVHDIDTLEDWNRAELIYQSLDWGNRGERP